MVLNRLSRMYPQFTAEGLSEPRYLIAVPGGGFQQHSRRVPESWFSDNLVIRLIEAGRVAEMLQHAGIDFRLCVSMPDHPELNARKRQGLQSFLARFGIAPEQVLVIDTARDSEAEITAFNRYSMPIILVSNSWHLPRLMQIARYCRCDCLPAPGGQLVGLPREGFRALCPTAGALAMLECALHELVGMMQLFCKYRIFRGKPPDASRR